MKAAERLESADARFDEIGPLLLKCYLESKFDLRFQHAIRARARHYGMIAPDLISIMEENKDNEKFTTYPLCQPLVAMGPAIADQAYRLLRLAREARAKEVRKAALEIIAAIGEPAAEHVSRLAKNLTEFFDDEDEAIVAAAATAVGALGKAGLAAVPRLQELVEGRHHKIWGAARMALMRLSEAAD